jgi:hypothetical protein
MPPDNTGGPQCCVPASSARRLAPCGINGPAIKSRGTKRLGKRRQIDPRLRHPHCVQIERNAVDGRSIAPVAVAFHAPPFSCGCPRPPPTRRAEISSRQRGYCSIVRLILGISLLLAGLGTLSVQVQGTPSPRMTTSQVVHWVRTKDGWERTDMWQAAPQNDPRLHPLVLAAGQGLVSALGLLVSGTVRR